MKTLSNVNTREINAIDPINSFNPFHILTQSAAALALLFALVLPALPARGATKTWTGSGVLEKWDSGLNWDGAAPLPGDDLVFPANGNVGYQTDNNFPAGTSFRSITMTSQAIGQTAIKGWHHGGHAISLQRSMTFLTTGAFAPLSTINFPVTLADDVTFYLEADGAVWGSGFGDSVLDLADHTLPFQNAPVA